MNICVFGLGYVGCVSLGCLAQAGHDVTGVDISAAKNSLINAGRPTIIERELEDLIATGVRGNRVRATADHVSAVRHADVSLVCVGTPGTSSGHLDMTQVERVAHDIGEGVKAHPGFHVVAIRSTVIPGTNPRVGEIIEATSGKRRGQDFAVVSHPEFLREGTAVEDFRSPPMTVIGSDSERATAVVAAMYRGNHTPVRRVPVNVAEIIKFASNSFHALKVAFANEVGNICKKLDVDSLELMNLFCEDRKLNISSSYLRPGFAYGGSCLPKDLRSLCAIANDVQLQTPLLESIAPSNDYHKRRVIDWIVTQGERRVGILGLSFKPGTDDLRNSPIAEVAQALVGKGYALRVFDRNVQLSHLRGRNKESIERQLPDIGELLAADLEQVIAECRVIVIANREAEFAGLPEKHPDRIFLDLVGVAERNVRSNGPYHGIAW